jgi:hypothetical protein
MRYIWEENDIKGGRVVTTASGSERLILGYDAGEEGDGDRTITSLADGSLIAKRQTKAQQADWLNKAGYMPALDVR